MEIPSKQSCGLNPPAAVYTAFYHFIFLIWDGLLGHGSWLSLPSVPEAPRAEGWRESRRLEGSLELELCAAEPSRSGVTVPLEG